MTAAFLITFREGFEAALIIGVLLSCLKALQLESKQVYVWGGVVVGVLLSLWFAWMFSAVLGGFEGPAEKIYEGLLMIGAAALITHLVLWMKKTGRYLVQHLNQRVETSVKNGMLWMIALIAAASVVREGVETVIFFQALMVQAEGNLTLLAPVLGVLCAIGLSVIIFKSTQKVPLAHFFQFMAYFLMLIAAGLLAHGIVEMQGAGWLPTFIKPVYDLSVLLPESHGIGAFLKAGFGYDANPSLLAVLGYTVYLISLVYLLRQRN